MLVIDDSITTVKLYLIEFKGEIQLMATNEAENTVLLKFNKNDHKIYTCPRVSTKMGFELDEFEHLIMNRF